MNAKNIKRIVRMLLAAAAGAMSGDGAKGVKGDCSFTMTGVRIETIRRVGYRLKA